MTRFRSSSRVKAAAVCAAAVTAAVIPVSLDGSRGLSVSAAGCQDGTCCPELESICIIGSYQRLDKYAKLGGGSCKDTDT